MPVRHRGQTSCSLAQVICFYTSLVSLKPRVAHTFFLDDESMQSNQGLDILAKIISFPLNRFEPFHFLNLFLTLSLR